jgi:hypothetical protein
MDSPHHVVSKTIGFCVFLWIVPLLNKYLVPLLNKHIVVESMMLVGGHYDVCYNCPIPWEGFCRFLYIVPLLIEHPRRKHCVGWCSHNL